MVRQLAGEMGRLGERGDVFCLQNKVTQEPVQASGASFLKYALSPLAVYLP